LPGSTKGSQECLESVAVCLPHAVSLLRDRIAEVKSAHKVIQSSVKNLFGHKEQHAHHHHHHHGSTKVMTKSIIILSEGLKLYPVFIKEQTIPYLGSYKNYYFFFWLCL
jgi:hypothetical protein